MQQVEIEEVAKMSIACHIVRKSRYEILLFVNRLFPTAFTTYSLSWRVAPGRVHTDTGWAHRQRCGVIDYWYPLIAFQHFLVSYSNYPDFS